jgi:geranylgeranyl pyrophosphate synthase
MALSRALPSPAPRPPAPSSAQLLREYLLSPQARAALAPTAAGVPERLWVESLLAPVLAVLDRPGKGFRGRLTEVAYRLAGGAGDPPPALAAVFEILHAGSMIVDDIEDDSHERRGAPAVHRLHGLPLALNAGNWMYFAPFQLLPALGLSPPAELQLRRRLSEVLLDCHFGQALDLGARLPAVPQDRLADVAATVGTLKTGRLLALAAEAGAMCAGAPEEIAAALAQMGEALGVGLQMLDDLGNLSGRGPAGKRYEDLRLGRVTWCWAWAATRLDAAAFADLVHQSEQVTAQAHLSIARPDEDDRFEPLAARLRTLVAGPGQLEAHRHLHQALRRLREQLARSGAPVVAALETLEQEIARLEVSYG